MYYCPLVHFSVACASISLGFVQATLEPHLRDFALSPLLIGAMFIVNGGCYGVSAPLWGFICDRRPPKAVAAVGAVTMVVAFALLGPVPFIPLQKSIPLVIVALVLQGENVL